MGALHNFFDLGMYKRGVFPEHAKQLLGFRRGPYLYVPKMGSI